MTKVPKKVEYRSSEYEFLWARGNILLYVSQPAHYYDDWEEDGEILVIQFYPDRSPGNAFEVVHQIHIRNIIETYDISKCNRMTKPLYE